MKRENATLPPGAAGCRRVPPGSAGPSARATEAEAPAAVAVEAAEEPPVLSTSRAVESVNTRTRRPDLIKLPLTKDGFKRTGGGQHVPSRVQIPQIRADS